MTQTPDQTVTDANNGGAISLRPGDTLCVHLNENPSTGYAWHIVLEPNGLFTLVSDAYTAAEHAPGAVGGGGVHEFQFAMGGDPNTTSSQRGWLRLLHLRSFMGGIDGAALWEILVTVG